MIKALLALVMAVFSQSQAELIKSVGVVRVQFVQTGGEYKMLPNEAARAVRTNEGLKYILINLDADLTDFAGIYWHEMSHLIAWERHGEGIEEHGPEFRRICRQLVKHRTKYFCGGD